MNYRLTNTSHQTESAFAAIKKFWPLLRNQKREIFLAFVAVIFSSIASLVGPLIIGLIVDKFIATKQISGVLSWGAVLFLVYALSAIATYFQTKLMGTVGQKLLFSLRSEIFNKLQSLPLAFFNQNKVGDLISRINNDTDKLNQFFSQALVQFISNSFMMVGAAIFLVMLNLKLGIASLVPAFALLIITKALSSWIKQKNNTNLKATGNLSAEISEALENFKLVAVFNRRDYFRNRFNEVNEVNYQSSLAAGVANNTLIPIYSLASNIAQAIVLFYGVSLIINGNLTVGLLVSYVSYVGRFYDPIRHVASIWSTFQIALAGWDRISEILNLKSELKITEVENKKSKKTNSLLEFSKVNFAYQEGKNVLHNISFDLEMGKTYAFVGPTGGGKTTIASLMSRLFDPTSGEIYLNGQDIKSFPEKERTQKIGFILQEPFLFSATIAENILYGNPKCQSLSITELEKVLAEFGLDKLLNRFPQGLETKVSTKGQLSLGQQQLIAFIRAILRKPELLILDEASANVDTVTEKLLDEILTKLPQTTTKVIIAHRFNTIENADEIFFVNAGNVTKAGSLKHAMELLLKEKRHS
ncbi:ABC transporter ATP-binding protein/permease [Patescibacteria group bacterium]|nr:ABC transporter ATP-binding protein/permease [Patescibacteria group bacterium]